MNNSTTRASELAAKYLTQLSTELAQGNSETLKQFLDMMGKFRRYSPTNSMLIYFQRPTATQVAGFGKWKEMGRQVKKGEKGIAIFVPLKYKAKAEGASRQEDDETLVGFTTGYLFDVEQTEGKPLPEFSSVKGDPGLFTFRLTNLILERGIELEYKDNLGGARGVSKGGRIHMLCGMSPAEEFQVLAHELAHELLHRGDRRVDTDVRTREVEAESVAYVCCSAIGLETGSASSDYIALYRGDEKLLSQSLAYIQNVSAQILDYILHPPAIVPAKLTTREQRELQELYEADRDAGWQKCDEYGFTGYRRTFGCDHGFDLDGCEGEDYIVLDFESDTSGADAGWWTIAYREVN